jgi:hypothetical protein
VIVCPGVSIGAPTQRLEPAASWFEICPPASLLPETDVACCGVCDLELRGMTFDFDYSNDFGQQLCGPIIFTAEPQSAESDQGTI